MTDLDTLRQALRVPQPAPPQGLDVDEIITRGRRLRWRRRLAVAAGGLCVAAAVSAGVLAGTGHPARPVPVPAQRPASPSRSVHQPSPVPSHATRTPVPSPTPSRPRAVAPVASPSHTPTAAASGPPVPVASPSRSR